jgi:hypothetical protein
VPDPTCVAPVPVPDASRARVVVAAGYQLFFEASRPDGAHDLVAQEVH